MSLKPLETEGNFRVRCMKYSLFKADSGSVAVNMNFEVLEGYDDEQGTWYDWRGEEIAVEGSFWIIKKDGTINERQVESLVAHCGWDGTMSQITDGKWTPEDCQVNVKKEVYKNQPRWKASFINGYDSIPGAGGGASMSAEEASQIEDAFGAGLRAAAANAKSKKAPAGRPPSPAKRPAAPSGPGAGDPPWNETEAATKA